MRRNGLALYGRYAKYTKYTTIVTFLLLSIAARNAKAQSVCPSVGSDTDCGVIITITDTGATVSTTGQGPYDDIEDTLVGVINNSSQPVHALALKSALSIFGFDGDGIDTFGVPGNFLDGTGYGGPNAYFTPDPGSFSSGLVNFILPIPAHGGTDFFSLEEAIGTATACSTLINNSLQWQASGENVCATFTPNLGFTLADAANICGFKTFDWVQKVTLQFDPSSFEARNLGGAFDSTVSGPVRLTSKRTPWSDPPQGGGYAPDFGGDADPDNSYPFYYDPNDDLAEHQDGSSVEACTLPITAGQTLTQHDAPADGCLPGGWQVGTAACKDPVLAPGAKSEPKGSFGGYKTHLAGVNFDGTATDLDIGFTWTSNYNGTTGKVSIKKTELAGDGTGTGGVTITSANEITSFGGVTVTGVNGAPPSQPSTLASGNACNGIFSGTFNGTITVSAGQSCAFVNGYITGDVQVQGGTLALSGVLVGGNVLIAGGGSFSIGPSTTINGNLEAHDIGQGSAQSQVCGSTVSGNLHLHNNAIPLQVGAASPSCMGNTVGGDLSVHNNAGPTSLYGNSVAGNLDDHSNTAASVVINNNVAGTLQCVGDTSVTGSGNTAGSKKGQCAGL